MKVCLITSNFPPNEGGIATFTRDLAYQLSCSSPVEKISVVAFNNRKPRCEEYDKMEFVIYPKMGWLKTGFKIFQQLFLRRDYDVFHATTLFPVGAWTVLFAKVFFKKPVFLTIFGTDILTREGSLKTRWVKKIAMKNATKVFTFSRSTAFLVSKCHSIGPQYFAVVYPGVEGSRAVFNPDALRQQFNLAPDDFIVLTVCRLVKRKGVDDILKALSLLPDSKIKLIVVGGGEEEDNLRQMTRQLGLEGRVIFVGSVPHEQIAGFYYLADVFVLASKLLPDKGDIEGLGIVFLEAQHYGLPVIGTASGGIPEAIDDGRSGFIIKEGDVKALAEKISLLRNDRLLMKKMGEKGKQFVIKNFSWEKSVQRHLGFYRGAY